MNELTFIQRNDVFTTSRVIAEGTQNQHESVVAIVKKHSADFEEFGAIEFTDLKSGKRGRPARIYLLNELQATLLVTYLDNTEIVRKFKVELVRQFYALRSLLLEKQTAVWQEKRLASKTTRLLETDAIKLLVAYAKEQGSQNADKLYITYTKLVKQLTGYASRDSAPADKLATIAMLERTIAGLVISGIQQELHYKEIYQATKTQLTALANIWAVPLLSA